MATLNTEEQAKVDRYEELRTAKRDGTQHVSDGQLANAKQLAEYAETNAEAREHMKAARNAERKAEADRVTARRNAEVAAAQEAYKRVAQATFPGTAEQFEAAWPVLLQQWMIRNTATDMDALIAQKRAMFADML